MFLKNFMTDRCYLEIEVVVFYFNIGFKGTSFFISLCFSLIQYISILSFLIIIESIWPQFQKLLSEISTASSSQNYGNKGSVLAHPYGGNFYEILGEIKWQKKKWLFKAFVNYHLYGADFTDSISYGGNIYASYNSHPNQYHNYIGQGIKTNGIKFMFSAAYLIDKSSNLQVFIENHFQGNTYYNIPGYQLVVGLRSCLWNDYRNYQIQNPRSLSLLDIRLRRELSRTNASLLD